MQGKKVYTEKLFTSFRLSERVPEDNMYRRLRELLDLDFVYGQTKELYGTTGLPSIDPKVFFKFMLVGYLEGISSDRKLVEHCSLRMDILYFLGYDVDEALPWHSTLSRTRQLYPKSLFEEVFGRVFTLCVEAGLVEGSTQAIDSTVCKANASKEKMEQPCPLNIHITKSRKDNSPSPDDDRPPAPPKGKLNSQKQSTVDPDARLATRPGKGSILGYLTSVAVDTSHHVITHIQPDLADKKDSECLTDIVGQVQERLGGHGLMLKQVLADANYSSGANYGWLEQQNMTAWIPVHGAYQDDREGFTYNPSTDSYTCRAGKELTRKRIYFNRKGNLKKRYAISAKDCKDCPFKDRCLTGKATYKTIYTSAYNKQYRRAFERQTGPQGPQMARLRSSRVEPVIGSLVNQYGIRKFRLRGLQAISKDLHMAGAAYNLKKLLKYTQNKQRKTAQMVINAVNQLYKSICRSFYLFYGPIGGTTNV